MKSLKLSAGKEATLDDSDYERFSRWEWSYMPSGYAYRNEYLGKVNGKYKYKPVFLHKEIIGASGVEVDHIDGDRLNNQRGNLRESSRLENCRNVRRHRDNRNRYKGIQWKAELNRWMTKICVNRKQIYIGLFDTDRDAALAYNEAALQYHGEFARLNEVD